MQLLTMSENNRDRPAGNYMFKVNKNTRISVFIVNFKHISHLALVFLLLTLSRKMLAGWERKCMKYSKYTSLREKCRNSEFSSPHFSVFEINTVFNPNMGKYGPEKHQIRKFFKHCLMSLKLAEFHLRYHIYLHRINTIANKSNAVNKTSTVIGKTYSFQELLSRNYLLPRIFFPIFNWSNKR